MTTTLEKICYLIIFILIGIGSYLSHFNEDFFRNQYIVEDGPLESGTAIFFVITGIIMLRRAFRLRGKRSKLFLTMTFLAAFVMFFGAGEEISWGQRIFGIETPETLAKHNKQGETNLHNLEIGDVSINKLIFSKLLAVVLVFYLLILPVLATKKDNIRQLTEKFAIPLPSKVQVIMWIVAMALPEIIVTTGKKGEVREACAGLIVFVTLLNPRNRHIYDLSKDSPHFSGGEPI